MFGISPDSKQILRISSQNTPIQKLAGKDDYPLL